MKTYTDRDRGCWADGLFGDRHVTRKTIQMALQVMDENPEYGGQVDYIYLQDALNDSAATPESLDSAAYFALEVLNTHCTGVYFTFHEGDLMLLGEGEEA